MSAAAGNLRRTLHAFAMGATVVLTLLGNTAAHDILAFFRI